MTVAASPAASPAKRRADQRFIGPFAFSGGQVGLLAGPSPDDLQLVVYDEAWPEGATGSRTRPNLTRFVGLQTLGELDAIRAAIAAAVQEGRG